MASPHTPIDASVVPRGGSWAPFTFGIDQIEASIASNPPILRRSRNPMPPKVAQAVASRAEVNAISTSPAEPIRSYPQTQMNFELVPAPEGWSYCHSIAIVLRGLTNVATTWNIWKSLSSCGNIVYIELFDDRQGQRSGRATVRFEPPPRRICWKHGRCLITTEKGESVARVDIQPMKGDDMVDTPLKNRIPAKIWIEPKTMSFGVLVQKDAAILMRTVQPQLPQDELKFLVDFKKRNIIVTFPVRLVNETMIFNHDYKMMVKFEQIAKIVRVELQAPKFAVVLVLSNPPAFFRKKTNVKMSHTPDGSKWTENELWVRSVDITLDPTYRRDVPETLSREVDYIQLGRWITYSFEMNQFTRAGWASIESALCDFNIQTMSTDSFKLLPEKKCEIWNILDVPHSFKDANSALALLEDQTKICLPFGVTYQLQVCISHGFINEHNITPDFIRKLAENSCANSIDSERAKFMLEYVADQRKRIYDPMTIFEDRGAKIYFPSTFKAASYCVVMRKATVTPTTIYFNSPTVETTNRVIRHYWNYRDYFLRVQFTDEVSRGQIIGGPDTNRDNEMYTRVHRVLFQGIRIGDRLYEFLAFGNSQIREAGAYFFCPNGGLSCDDIRAWMGMGNLGHIKTVAKVAARLGQCFSTTRVVHGISAPRLTVIPDIERNGYCFTDGVGKISSFLARAIAQDWGLPSVPSVFQFRMGGCKGILAVDPALKGPDVHIRPSQQKFATAHNILEIIKCSQYSVASLNRQSITILSNLGIPDEVFEDMAREQLASYDEALRNPQVAVRLLGQCVDENQMTVNIAKLILDGFMEAKEPFVMTLLYLWRSWSIKLLKEKAKLMVTDGAFLFGCVDETGILRGHVTTPQNVDVKGREDDALPQIFLQVPDPTTRHGYRVITGLCLIGRNPSLHPGDLRVAEAVDVPELWHLRDVIVFPQKGDRDVPSMCSGGDLDGDDFFVIWDKKLIPSLKNRNYPPMEFESPSPTDYGMEITIDDLKTFFVLYMKNNSLPIIAHAHLAWADYLTPDHSKHPRCLELAQLHSKAVDYVKSGEPAIMDKKLHPREWPHWMEKRGKSYRSHEALGKIYDRVNPVLSAGSGAFTPGSYAAAMPFDARVLRRCHPNTSRDLLRKARAIKSAYDVALRRLMGALEIRTEAEVWSAFVLSRPRVGSGYKLQEAVDRQGYMLKQQFRDACVAAAGGSRDFEKLGPFVAAMYRVTCEEVQIALHESNHIRIKPDGKVERRGPIKAETMPLISFPWLFDTVLGRLATGSAEHDEPAKLAFATAATSTPASATAPAAMEQAAVLDKGEKPVKNPDIFDIKDMEYTRTKDGKILHRGHVLRLFYDDDEDDDDLQYYVEGAVSEEYEPDGTTQSGEDSQPGLAWNDVVSLGGGSGQAISEQAKPQGRAGEGGTPPPTAPTVVDLLTSGPIGDGNVNVPATPPPGTDLLTGEARETLAFPNGEPFSGEDLLLLSDLKPVIGGGGAEGGQTALAEEGTTVDGTTLNGDESDKSGLQDDSEGDDEIQYRDVFIVDEEETAMERAIRLGSS